MTSKPVTQFPCTILNAGRFLNVVLHTSNIPLLKPKELLTANRKPTHEQNILHKCGGLRLAALEADIASPSGARYDATSKPEAAFFKRVHCAAWRTIEAIYATIFDCISALIMPPPNAAELATAEISESEIFSRKPLR